MNVILDASSTINLHHGDLLGIVLSLDPETFKFHMGVIVRGECGGLASYLEEQNGNGRLVFLPSRAIAARDLADILNRYELGLGESECIVHAERRSLIVCSDDKAARKAVEAHLGYGRVVGSVKLIRECVVAGTITSTDAYARYELMRSRGAFLPDIDSSYFDC